MDTPLSDEEIATQVWQKYFGDYAFVTRNGNRPLIAHEFVAELSDLINTQKRLYAESEVKRVKNQLNDVLFYETVSPSGHFIKECLMNDLDAIQAEQRARIK